MRIRGASRADACPAPCPGYPVAFTLLSTVVFLYVLFSPVGLVGGISSLVWILLGGLVLVNVGVWAFGRRSAAAAA